MSPEALFPPRVLIIDDDPLILQILHDILVSAHYDVYTLVNAGDAVDVALAIRPDAILLDLVLPETSGNEVLRALREHGVSAPVVALTGRPDLAGPGFFDVLAKPLVLAKVPSLVADVVRFGRDAG
jgi:two-component system, OmpR family, response regulator